MMRVRAAWFGVLMVLSPAGALAEPRDVEAGHALLQEADFEGALAAFEQAEAGGGLSRAALVRMLEGRVLAHYGLGHRAAMEQALGALAALDPTHAFGPQVPPEVAERFTQIAAASGGELGVRVQLLHGAEGYELVARPVRAPAGLVRRVRLLARLGEEGWREGVGAVAFERLPPGSRVFYFVELLGPGGAILLREEGVRRPGERRDVHGDASAEEEASSSEATGAPDPLRPAPPRRKAAAGGGAGLWIGLGVGAALVLGGVAAAVLLAGGSGAAQTMPRPPRVEGF